jgi:hypothetical protein
VEALERLDAIIRHLNGDAVIVSSVKGHVLYREAKA